MTTGDEGLDHLHLLRDVGHSARLDVRRQEVERGAVGMKLLRPALGEFNERLSGLLRVADRFIIDVGDVTDVQSRRAAELDHAAEDILSHEGAEVSNVRRAINGGPAAVEAECLAIDGADGLWSAGEGIV